MDFAVGGSCNVLPTLVLVLSVGLGRRKLRLVVTEATSDEDGTSVVVVVIRGKTLDLGGS